MDLTNCRALDRTAMLSARQRRQMLSSCCRYPCPITYTSIFTPLVSLEKREIYSLAEIMGGIKGASAQLINQALGRRGRAWQTESFDRVCGLRIAERKR